MSEAGTLGHLIYNAHKLIQPFYERSMSAQFMIIAYI